MKKKLLVSLTIIGMALAATPILSHIANEEIVYNTLDSKYYREEIYDKGVKPVKLELFDYNDYSQSPTGDQYYNTQKNYHLNSLELGTTWNNYRGDGVTIAVIDTGINYSHNDFVYYQGSGTSISDKSACFEDPNGTGTATRTTVLNDGWSVMADANGHGTNVASTIASRINGTGCVGVAPNVNLIFCKCPNLMSSEVSAAIRYSADQGANIITMSIGMYATSFTSTQTNKTVVYASNAASLFSSAINYAHNKGCIIFASAGNDDTEEYSYPACNNYVIGVGALAANSRTTKATYSNYNKSTDTQNGNHNVDVTVVGSVYVATKTSSSSYGSTQGTSFSCPITAAAMALYLQSHPSWTIDSATQALYDSCDDIGSSGWDTTFGYGCVNISSLVGISYDVSGISLDKEYAYVYDNNNTTSITATVTPSYATNKNISWSIGDSTIATISSNSSTSGNSITITGKKAGSTTLTATSSQGGYTAICTVSVSHYVSSEFTVTSSASLTMVVGDTSQITTAWVNNNPTSQQLLYDSNNKNVATVDDNGLITAIGAGSATITIASSDDMKYVSVTVSSDAPHEWIQVTDASTLVSGDKLVFVYESAGNVNGSLNGTYLNSVSGATVTDHVIATLPDNADVLTLGGSSGAWTFTMSSTGGLLYADSGSFYSTSQSGRYSTYTISINNGNAVIKANNSYQIYYNTGSPRFKPYSNAQGSFQLYKKEYIDSTKTLDHISINGYTTTYYVGDTFSFDGTCTAYWVGDSIGTISAIVVPTSVTSPDMSTDGPKQITVTYQDVFGTASANYVITVSPVTLTSITLTGPTKTSYVEGETFSTTGLVVTAHYSNGSSHTVNNYVVDTSTLLTTSDTSWQVSYTEDNVTVYANVTITVSEYVEDTSVTLNIDFTNSNSSCTEITKNTTWSVNNNGSYATGSYLSMKSPTTFVSNTNSIKMDTSKTVTIGGKIGTYGGSNSPAQAIVFGAYNSNDVLVSNQVTKTATGSSAPTFSDVVLTFTSTSDKNITIKGTAANVNSSKYLRLYNMSVSYTPYPDLNSVSLNKNSTTLDLYNSATETLVATVNQDSGVNSTLSWSSSDSTVATVNQSGVVTAKKVGSATITVTATYNTTVKTATCTVTVVDTTPIEVTSINLDKNVMSLQTGGSGQTLTVSYNPINANQLTTYWTTSNSGIASISSNSGSSITVNPVAKGQALITATCNGYTATCTVTVSDVVAESISLNRDSASLIVDGTIALTATVLPANTTNKLVNWSSSDSTVASVTSAGEVTAKKVGTTTITASTTDGSNLQASCTIEVIDKVIVTSIEISNYSSSALFGGTYSTSGVVVTAYYSDSTSRVVTGSASIVSIDTGILGPQNLTASYTEENITVNTSVVVTVTNVGASGNVGNSSSQTTQYSKTGTFTSTDVVTTTPLTFTPSGSPAYEAARGLQWSKKAGSVTITGVPTGATITSISLKASSNCGVNVSCTVGGSSFGSTQSVANGDSNATKTFSGSASAGNIVISITAGNKSGYIKQITVNYSVTESISYPKTPTEQAIAWATYFLSEIKQECDINGVNSNVSNISSKWVNLGNEYTAMVNDAKDAFSTSSDSTIVEARTLYGIIISKYSSQTITNFAKDGSGNNIVGLVHNPLIKENVFDTTIILIAVSLSFISLVSGYLFYRRKRK